MSKSPSIDGLYAKLDKHILLAESYCEIKHLSFLIKACRFKPHNYIFEDKDIKLKLHKFWFDEHGNSLKIIKNKQLKITYNDLSLDRNKIICTDLYYGLSLEKILKISKLAYICIGKDDDLFQNCVIVSFLGIDNYLRTYSYMYGEWKQIASSLLGIETLLDIGKNLDLTNFIELNIKENIPMPCVSGKAWLSFLPASEKFLQLMLSYDVITLFNTKE